MTREAEILKICLHKTQEIVYIIRYYPSALDSTKQHIESEIYIYFISRFSL